jgi:aminoglycoside 3-N-acetyltransferase
MERGMIAYRDFVLAFRDLDIPPDAPIIAHASLSAFGHVQGGAETLLGAMMNCYPAIIMPAFTYRTMVVPEIGPANNGLRYGEESESNRATQFFQPNMPIDSLMGIVPETMRKHHRARRSNHPILSFVGIDVDEFLDRQRIDIPLMPIEALRERGGWILLLGVEQEVNTSIHNAERLSGRRQFVRWALTEKGILECPGFPGCSEGFGVLSPSLASISRRLKVGAGKMTAIPLVELTEIVIQRIKADPLALLCDRPYCPRCESIRKAIREGDQIREGQSPSSDGR